MVLFLPTWLPSQQVPFQIEIHKKAQIDELRATKIYDSVCSRIARELNPSRPPDLRPKFVLVIGDLNQKTTRIESSGVGPTRIYLREWNECVFAYTVALVAIQQSVPRESIMRVASLAIKALNATVDVRDLRK